MQAPAFEFGISNKEKWFLQKFPSGSVSPLLETAPIQFVFIDVEDRALIFLLVSPLEPFTVAGGHHNRYQLF